jgi:hypothetical protein
MINQSLKETKGRHMLTKGQNLVLIVTVIALLSLAACHSQASYSNQPTATSSICLVGIWSIRHPETFYRYSLPPGAFDLNTLTFKDSKGGIGYRFDGKGVLTVEAVGFTGKFDVQDGAEISPLEIKMDGLASGNYTIDGDTVRLDQVLNSELNYSATYAGQDMMNTKKIEDFAPLFVQPYRTAKFECTPDKLTLQIMNFPGYQEKIEFQRLVQ